MATVIIPPVLNGVGDLVPAILDVRLVLADGSSAIGFVATDLVTEYQNTTIPEEGVTLTLTPQSDIALEDGAATYYAISIRTQYKEQTYTVQVADAVEDQLLSALVAASTIDPADILALYLVPSGGTTSQVLEKVSADDYDVQWGTPDAANITNTPSGNIEAETVQAAIDELDAEKVAATVLSDIEDPTGFLHQEDIDVQYNNPGWPGPGPSRAIVLTGTLEYYWRGVKHTLTSPWTSDQHDEGDGTYYLSSTDGTTFAWSESPWTFEDIQVARVTVADSGATVFGQREPHGVMPFSVHQALHSNVGTWRKSGLTLDPATYTVNTASDAATTPGFLEGVIVDEDLETTIPAWAQGTYTTVRIGAASTAVFDLAASFPFRSSGSYILVNTPSAGTEAATVNNRYVNIYQLVIPVASDTDSQKYRMLMLQPQTAYTSLAAAQAEDPRGLVLGTLTDLAAELVFHARITYVTAAGDANTGKCRIATNGVTYLTGGRASQVSVSGYTVPIAANIIVAATPANYTPASPDLEAHLAAIDAALGALA